jgi:hypothetical protein
MKKRTKKRAPNTSHSFTTLRFLHPARNFKFAKQRRQLIFEKQKRINKKQAGKCHSWLCSRAANRNSQAKSGIQGLCSVRTLVA